MFVSTNFKDCPQQRKTKQQAYFGIAPITAAGALQQHCTTRTKLAGRAMLYDARWVSLGRVPVQY